MIKKFSLQLLLYTAAPLHTPTQTHERVPERLAESYRACRVSTGNGTHPTPKLATELRNGLKPSAVRLVAALHHIHQQTEGLSFDKMLRHEKRL